ncbi:MAG TPA: hypothetical protein VM123_11175 [archaeon]|nr:hypothetical protein [archaeon]
MYGTIAIVSIVLFVLLVLYYVFLARTILQMLRSEVNTVLLVFAFSSLLCIPPTVIMGILVMIIWKLHKKTLPGAL